MANPADRFSLVALDMNGTTVRDGGIFDSSLARAFESVGLPVPPTASIAPLRGMAKTEMFQRLIPDTVVARQAYEQFISAFLDSVAAGAVRPVTGTTRVLRELHDFGLSICLVTGFPLVVQHAIIDALRWAELIDLSVSSDEVERGRPHPDIVRYAADGLGVDRLDRTVVVGDTVNDLLAGERAGAGLVVGVLTGSHRESELRAVPAAHIVASIVDLPDLLVAVANSASSTD